jgi:hypothetical protein
VFSAVDPLISLLVEFIFIGRRCCAKYAIVSYMLRMRIKRDVEARLKRSAKMRPVIVLTGARQTENSYLATYLERDVRTAFLFRTDFVRYP